MTRTSAEDTTLSQELISPRIAENNSDEIFSKLVVDRGCDDILKLPKKNFF